jgi:hypothetical protein
MKVAPLTEGPTRTSQRRTAELMYKILLGTDILIALIVGYFLFDGLTSGWISGFNMQLWIVIVFAIAAIIGGGIALRRAGWPVLANFVLAVLAVPAVLYAVFVLAFAVSGTKWI